MTIETERLILRPFLETDAADVFEYLEKPAVNCFVCMKLNSVEEAKAEMKKRTGETEYYFAITLKDSGKVIGEIDAYPEPGEPHSDETAPKDTFSPCWMLNKSYQGKGYAYEAAHAFFDYLFKEKGARRIYAYTEDYNISSQRLCEKLGMRREGHFIEFVSFVNNEDGTPHYENTMQYAILKNEWEKQSVSQLYGG
ncbi:MAG: GNAT family N-acetyltransferase [Ruminiclostridium sp.]|nr:GNAT family N-acetyltransferase [Ruminiclostridium sp.]